MQERVRKNSQNRQFLFSLFFFVWLDVQTKKKKIQIAQIKKKILAKTSRKIKLI
jgi:hypothetical protein